MNAENMLLVENSKKGDMNAFSRLYAVYSDQLYRFAVYMTGNTHDAEDAVQEAVLSAWQNIHNLKDNERFKVWIFKILANKCRTMLVKNNKNTNALPVEEYDFLVPEGDGHLSTELKDALNSLTPPDGQIIILTIIGGFKSHELAEIYNMTPSTVRSRQKRGLEKLKGILS